MSTSLKDISRNHPMLAAFGGVTILSLWLAVATGWYGLAAVPVVLLVGFITIADFKWLYLCLFALLPISIEYQLPNGFGIDLPDEPLMIALSALFLLFGITKLRTWDFAFIKHPISLALMAHLLWMFTTVLFSDNLLVSVKFMLAKLWYVIPFYFMAGYFIRNPKHVYQWTHWILLPLMVTVIWTLVKHASLGFAFNLANEASEPFYRNHVNYACILVLFLPYVWWSRKAIENQPFKKIFYSFCILILILGIQFSYTRAAILCLFIGIGAYHIIQLKWIKQALFVSLLVGGIGITWLVSNNHYLRFMPEYEKAVTQSNFDNLVEATAKGEDVSTMERVYRWVAGGFMVGDRPWMGFGPGNFYNFYHSYTVLGFQTYVSDNAEQSGVHCYYLMTAVEQGATGFFIFLILVVVVIVQGEKIYHATTDPRRKEMVMMALLSFIIICALQLINDLLEADKVGPFFFVAMAILINAHRLNQADHAT